MLTLRTQWTFFSFWRRFNMERLDHIFRKSYHSPREIESLQKIPNYEIVDLRSDTVTKPGEKMLSAMMAANVGDDVYQEDTMVIELEKRVAEITKKEAGLFVVSGTMGNLLCVLCHCQRRGSEVLVGNLSHIFNHEQANISQLGGVQPFPVPTLNDGTYDLSFLESCIRDHTDFHNPRTELICAENTHGHLGGKVVPLRWLDELGAFAAEKGLNLHLDGARVFSASIASGVPVSRILKPFDSCSVCFSKNLGAPVGSVIVGMRSFIDRARRLRKALGGGWRQAGYLGAAALFALDHNVDRLAIDHENARKLAAGINNLGSDVAFVNEVHTNMVLLQLNVKYITAEDFCIRLMLVSEEEAKNIEKNVLVKALANSNSSVRFVTHLDVSQQQIEDSLKKILYVIREIID